MGNNLINLKKTSIGYLFNKPKNLTKENENELIKFIKKKQNEKFLELGSKIIKNSENVDNLYIYLKSICDKNNLKSKLINDRFKYILNSKKEGFLMITNPLIKLYLNKKVSNEEIKFFEKYKEYLKIEEMINYNIKWDEEKVLKYINFLKKLFKEKKINEKQIEDILKIIEDESLIYKKSQILGSLVSEKFQEELKYKKIFPQIIINKK